MNVQDVSAHLVVSDYWFNSICNGQYKLFSLIKKVWVKLLCSKKHDMKCLSLFNTRRSVWEPRDIYYVKIYHSCC